MAAEVGVTRHLTRNAGCGMASPVTCTTQNSYVKATGTSQGATLNDPNGYWNTRTYQLLSFVSRSEVTGSGPGAVTEYTYDNGGALTRANVTQVRQWDSTRGGQTNPLAAANAVIVNNTWDGYGNLVGRQNARGYTSGYTWDANGLYITHELAAYRLHFTFSSPTITLNGSYPAAKRSPGLHSGMAG